MKRKERLNRALDSIVDIVIETTSSIVSRDEAIFGRNVFFEWLKTHLNSAICGKCHAYLGSQGDVPIAYTRCSSCGEVAEIYKITPIKLRLALDNKISVFNLVPDDIKLEPLKGLGPFKGIALKVYDSLTLEAIEKPFLMWLEDERPDLYYTVFMYPQLNYFYLDALNHLIFGFKSDKVEELEKKYEMSGDKLIEAIKDGFRRALTDINTLNRGMNPSLLMYNLMNGKTDDEQVKYVAKKLGVEEDRHAIIQELVRRGASLEGVKIFLGMIEDVRIKTKSLLEAI